MSTDSIPDGYRSVTASLVVDGAEQLIEFIKNAFGGKERLNMPRDDGKVMHAEVEIGNSVVMVGDSMPDFPPVQNASLHLYVEDVDAVYQQALAAGATSIMEPTLMFYGDRSAAVLDEWGTRWAIGTHVEDVSPEEMMKRRAEKYQLPAGG
ncbi:MAG: VOC family protein [Dehalococcoidia bacterium]